MPEENTAKELENAPDATSRNTEIKEEWFEPVRDASHNLQFGSVVIIV